MVTGNHRFIIFIIFIIILCIISHIVEMREARFASAKAFIITFVVSCVEIRLLKLSCFNNLFYFC